jgi:cell division septation protein DedD
MSKDAEPGLSAIQLALVFLTGVAVCAVFFAMGFVVGRNQQPPTVSANANAEQAPPPEPVLTPVSTASAPTSENASPASAPAESGVAARRNPETTPVSSALTVAPSPVPTTLAREAPPRSETKQLPAAAIPSATPSAASTPEVAPKTAAAPPSRSAGPAAGGRIVVQVSATGVRQDAETLVNLLKSRGYPAFLVTPEEAGAADRLFRVQVGPYKADPEAVGVRNKLMAEGFKPFLRH